MSAAVFIGDAVIPRDEPDHDVMTVFDLTGGYTVAHCNWLVGHRMIKKIYPVSSLLKLRRASRNPADRDS